MSSRRFMWLSYEMEVSYVYVNLCPDTTLLSESVHMSSEHLCGACWGLCAVLCFFQPFLIWESTSPQRPTNGAGYVLQQSYRLLFDLNKESVLQLYQSSFSHKYPYTSTQVQNICTLPPLARSSDDDPNNCTKDEEKREKHRSCPPVKPFLFGGRLAVAPLVHLLWIS